MPSTLTVLDVIAEPTRRRILDAVRSGERSVGELVDEVGMHQPGVSRHLKVLRDAGLDCVLLERDAELGPARESLSADFYALEDDFGLWVRCNLALPAAKRSKSLPTIIRSKPSPSKSSHNIGARIISKAHNQ